MLRPMRIATWNVNSVRARLPRLLPWLAEKSHDVVCLQELKCVEESFPRAEIEQLGYQVEMLGQKSYNGVAILSRRPISSVRKGIPGEAGDAERRVIAGTIDGVTVMNVYVVNGQQVGAPKYAHKLEWMARLAEYVQSFDLSQPFVLLGDFNVTFDDRDVHDPALWKDKILCSEPERERLRALGALGLSDAFRHFIAEGGHYTWWDFRTFGFQRKQGLRIDHLLMSAAALERCRSVTIDLDARRGDKPSDHAPVVAELEIGGVGP